MCQIIKPTERLLLCLTMGVACGNFLKAQESCAKVMFDDEAQMGVVCYTKQLATEHKSGKL